MARRTPNRPQRKLTADQIRYIRGARVLAEQLIEERRRLRTRLRQINDVLPTLGYNELAAELGVSPRTIESAATYIHYKEIR